MNSRPYYFLTLSGFFTVLLTIFTWPLCCFEDEIPVAIRWGFLLLPILFPIHGLLKGKPYTFAWSHFLALLYFILAVVALWQGDELIYGSLLLVGSLVWFCFALLYIRAKARERKALEQT